MFRMKQMVRNYFGKSVMLILAIVMAASVTWMFDGEGSIAYAADGIDYFTESQTGLTITENMTAPRPTKEGKESYIFAGYYKEKTCETPVRGDTNEVVYKKFVPADIMNVKAQVTQGTKNNTPKTDMRLVTTVDGLNYKEVGFDIYYDGASKPINLKTTKVYKKISAAKGGNEFAYSPNAFDLDSEYFTTVNLLNIANRNFDKTFFIKPYWKTLDGTKVYGISRIARVSDSYNDIANIPVRIYEDNVAEGNTITISYNSTDFVYQNFDIGHVDADVTVTDNGDGTITCTTSQALSNVNDMLVNLRFEINATASSNENFAMEGAGACSYLYKLFDTEYHGTLDTSWYDESSDVLVISSPAELYGFASIVNDGETFTDKTVYLATDITINDMTVDEMMSDEGIVDPVVWTAIGYNANGTRDANVSNYFRGTFDGQNHKIQGLYVTEYGMFGWAYGATIRNFSLKDSYIDGSTSPTASGSIVSTFDGTMESVYSDATIVDTSGTAGGLIARITNGGKLGTDLTSSRFSVKNCWYAGEIIQNYTGTSSATCGGLVGLVVQGTAEKSHVIEHSLYTGKMNCTYTTTKSGKYLRTGGLVGALNSATMPLELLDCLSAGEPVEKTATRSYEGSVVGYNGTTTVPSGEYVYATEAWNECTVNQGTHAGVIIPTGTVTSYLSYTNMPNLDYYDSKNPDGYWVVRDDAVPALKSFADEWIDVAWYYDNNSNVYTLNTAEELCGFSAISQDVPFSGKTVQLGNDIKVNKKTINKDSYTEEVWNTFVGSLREWKSIGNTSSRFAGKFDGKGHTISGLYQHATENYSGLFASTDDGSEVRDLKLTNSYFVSDAGFMGSIAGQGAGTFDTIYSNAVVEGAGTQIGGLIGRVNKVAASKHVINNCWFDGEVTLYNADTKVYGGAIAGAFVQGELDITNCLNTGTVTHISAADATKNTNYYVGGFCGAPMNASCVLLVSNCLNAGEIKDTLEDGTETTYNLVSASVGCAHAGTTTLNGFFYLSEYCDIIIRGGSGTIVWNGHKDFSQANVTGKSSYINAVDNKNNKLNFWSSSNPNGCWVVTEDSIPALKSFTDEWIDVAWYYDTEDYDGGNHTFELSTPEEFYGFSAVAQEYSFENDTVKLCKNVVLDEVEGREWTPVGSSVDNAFQGTFNGNGKKISGIYVTLNDSNNYAGLFGWVADATIKNFTLSDSTFTGTAMAMGAIVGNGDGTVANIYCDSSVLLETSSTTTVGGIFGRVQDPLQSTNADRIANTLLTVNNCWFDGNIKQTIGENSTTTSGGIVGYLIHGTANIENCLFTGSIDSAKTASGNKHLYVGGIFGKANGTSATNYSIKNSLGAGSAIKATVNSCNKYVGAIAGQTQGNETFLNVYATSESASSAAGQLSGGSTQPTTPVDENEFHNTIKELEANYWVAQETDIPALKSFSDSYEIPENIEWLYESVGNEMDPFVLSNAEELEGFGALVNAGTTFKDEFVQLANDIVVYEGDAKEWAKGQNLPAESWTPIGTVNGDIIANGFQGTFDGDGNAIQGLYVTDEAGTYLGLFRKIKDATVCNLRIENSYFNTNKAAYIGSVAGGGDGTFDSVYSSAIVHGSRFVGGLIGRVSENTTNSDTEMILTNCHFDGAVDLDYTGSSALYSGGLVGYVVHGSTLIDTCLYTGKITLECTYSKTDATQWGAYVGALCGGDNGNATNIGYVQVKNCISAGSMSSKILSASANPEVTVVYMNQTIGYGRHANTWAKNTYVILNNTRTLEKTGVTTESDETYARGSGSLAANYSVDSSFEEETLYGYGAQMWTNLAFTEDDRIAADNAALEEGAEEITVAGPIWAAIAGELPVPATLADNALEMTVGKPDTDLEGDGLSLETAWEISSVEELAGFALLSKDDNFAGEYVVLTKNIVINKDEDASKWVDDKAEPTLPWAVAIGDSKYTNGKYFEGIFDGQDHTISGICFENGSPDGGVKDKREFVGLFATTEVGSEVRNLRLTNSYFEQVGTGWVGSVIGKCRGTVSNVYSDAIIKSSAENIGGIIAMADGYNYDNASKGTESRISRNVDNCWYAGEIILGDEGRYSGGIIGLVNQGEWILNNCVFTGKITSGYTGTSYAYVGGMAGALEVQKSTATSEKETKLTLNSCISAGTIKTANGDYGAGAFVGRAKAEVYFTDAAKTEHQESRATHIVMNNVFATRDSGYQEVGSIKVDTDSDASGNKYTATPTATGAAVWTNNADRLVGYCTEETKGDYKGGSLDFNTFVIRKEGVPVPKNFTDLANVTPITNVDEILALATMDEKWTTASAVNYGLGHYVLRATGKTYENYTEYLAALETQGFTPYITLEETGTDGVYNMIYTKAEGEWVLNILFVQNTGEVTLTISNGLDSLSPDLEPENSSSGTVTLSMLQLEGSKTAFSSIQHTLGYEDYYYGNSFVFKLPNGHFVINDGGNQADMAGLMKYLRKEAGLAENDTTSKIYIDAWTVTHQHSDHFSVMRNIVDNPQYAKQLVVNAIYVNEPNRKAMLCEEGKDSMGTVAVQYRGIRMLKDKDGNMPKVYWCQTGQTYYFDGLTMNVIQSQEQILVDSYGKRNAGAADGTDFNTASTNMLFKTANGKKVLITGDSNDVNMKWMMKAYGSSSEMFAGINVYQVVHHGKNTSYNISSADHKFTDYVAGDGKIDVSLFPCSVYYDYSGKHERASGVFPAAELANKYLIETVSVSAFNYGEGTVKVTLGNEITAQIDDSIDTGTDTPDIEAGEGE